MKDLEIVSKPTRPKREMRIKCATGAIVDEFRALNVGDVVSFPLDQYSYSSIRATPTALGAGTENGPKWQTQMSSINQCVFVKRIS